jgi:vacuolar-type H+-ATPase subunit E/Vma4
VSVAIFPLSGELRAIMGRLVALDEVIYTLRAERKEAFAILGSADKEVDASKKALEKALEGEGDSISRKDVERALAHLRRSQQYKARLNPRQHTLARLEISLSSMFRIHREELRRFW